LVEVDIGSKISLLRADRYDMAMASDTPEDRERFWNQLVSELPAFLYWLINEYEIPSDWRTALASKAGSILRFWVNWKNSLQPLTCCA
jgi:hypothetical protein